MRIIGRIEPFDPNRTCVSCIHWEDGGKCNMYGNGNLISFDHRLNRCNHFDAVAKPEAARVQAMRNEVGNG